MNKLESEKIGEALYRWLDDQGVSSADGINAMAFAIGAMLGRKAEGLFRLTEGLSITTQLIHVTALEYMNNQGTIRI